VGIRTETRLEVPGEDAWIDVKFPSRLRVRALKAEATSGKRLPGEEKTEATGWNFISSLLHDCVKGWSYVEGDGEPMPVTPENIDDLDNKTGDWLFKTLMGTETTEEKKAD